MTSVQTPAVQPLSVAQEALWYMSRLVPDRLDYNDSITIAKEGPLDIDALRRAMHEVVCRHEAWRTTFDLVDGQPVQVVQPPPTLPLPVVDLSDLRPAQARREAQRIVSRVVNVPYDLRHGPLVRPRLITFPGDHHELVLAMHHVVFDGLSVSRVVLPELVTLYDAFRAGRPSPLAPAARYADYARWEQEWIAGARAARRLAYWRERLAGAPPTSLPLDRRRPARRSFQGGVVPVSLAPVIADGLHQLGHRCAATLFQVLAAVWAVLLSRYAGQDEVVFATAADLRQRPEFEAVVGYCLTPLVLRLDAAGDPTLAELVVRVRSELLDALEHLVPFERVVRELEQGRVSNANPLYQTMVVLEPSSVTPDPAWSLKLGGDIDAPVRASKLDIELQLDERSGGGLEGRLIYDLDLFQAASARRLADHWQRVATAAATADPAVAISTLAPPTAAEVRRQTVEWNATRSRPSGSGVVEVVRGVAGSDPQRRAVAAPGADLTYRELDCAAAAWAAELRARGVQRGDVVTLEADDSAEPVLRMLGTLATGAAYAFATAPEDERPRGAVDDRAALEVGGTVAAEIGLGLADTALVLVDTLQRASVLAVWAPVCAGARIVVAPAQACADGAQLSRLIAHEDATFLAATPTLWQRLLDTGLRARRGVVAVSTGEPLSRELATAILERCALLWNVYGTAETAGCATLGLVAPDAPLTIGRPIAGARAYVVDRQGQPCPLGAVGELRLARNREPQRTGDRARWTADGQLALVGPAMAAAQPSV